MSTMIALDQLNVSSSYPAPSVPYLHALNLPSCFAKLWMGTLYLLDASIAHESPALSLLCDVRTSVCTHLLLRLAQQAAFNLLGGLRGAVIVRVSALFQWSGWYAVGWRGDLFIGVRLRVTGGRCVGIQEFYCGGVC